MTLTDDQLTDTLTSGATTPDVSPAWADIVHLGRRQRQARAGGAVAVLMVAAGLAFAIVTTDPVGDPLATSYAIDAVPAEPDWQLATTASELVGAWDIATVTTVGSRIEGESAYFEIQGSNTDGIHVLSFNNGCETVEWLRVEFDSARLRSVPERIPVGRTVPMIECEPSPGAVQALSSIDLDETSFTVEIGDDALRLLGDDVEIVATRRPSNPNAAPAAAEVVIGSWRLMDLSFGPPFESATQRIVVVIDEDRLSVDGPCAGLIVNAEWQGTAFVGRNPEPGTFVDSLGPRLIRCTERELLMSIGSFLMHGDPVEVFLDGDSLLLRRADLQLRAVRLPPG